MIAVLKKELKTNFTSLTTYLYYMLFFLATGIYFSVYCLANYNTQFGYYVLAKVFPICILMIPLFTMRMFAQEKRRRTEQLLFTVPVSETDILLGKYCSVTITVFLPIILSLIYPIIVSRYDDFSVNFVTAAYIGVCLLIVTAISVGTFFSSLTGNIFLAALFTYAFFIIFILLRVVESISGDNKLFSFLHTISPYNIFNNMISGIVKSGDVIYLLISSILFFYLTWLVINKRHIKKTKLSLCIISGILIFVLISIISFSKSIVYDFTPEKMLSLSDQTKQILSDINSETDIYYMGKISTANATYTEFLRLYENSNDNIKVHYKEIDKDINFQIKYMKDISMINEASLLVVRGDSFIYLDSNDYISSVQISDYLYKSILNIEEQLTKAIYNVNQEDNYKIYCIEGHNEQQISGKILNYINLSGYDIKYFNMSENMTSLDRNIPDDCSIILINAPQYDYSEDEINVLKEYIDNGGQVSVFIDPLNEDINNFYLFLKDYGFNIVSGVVIEKDPTRYAYDTEYCLAPRLKNHEITDTLIDQGLYVYTMTSKGIEVDDSISERTDLLLSSAKAFSKISDFDNLTTKNDGDIGGPFSIASIYEKNNGKIILVTSNIIMDNDADNDTLGGNHKFIINSLDYLSGRVDNINIEGKDVSYNTASFHNSVIKKVQILVIVIIPLLIISIGVVIIVIRKKNIIIKYNLKKEQKKSDEESEEK